MGKFLDEAGLSELWKRIKDKFGFTTDDTLTLQNDVLSVSIPVKGVLKEEFDRMSEEEKKGLVVVTDDNTLSVSQGGEIYSAEEMVIGTWIDGKPLYRRVHNVTGPAKLDTSTVVLTLEKNISVIRLYGRMSQRNGNITPIPQYWDNTKFHSIYWEPSTSNIYMTVHDTANNPQYVSAQCYIIVEYTKTTN